MPHITLPKGVPGIVGPMKKYPAAAKQLSFLAGRPRRGCGGAG